MDFFFARGFAETFRAFTPIPGSNATFSQTPCFLPSPALRALRKAFSSLRTSKTSGRITTQRSSRGRKTFAAPGPGLRIVTANVSGGCGDFICSVAQAHFARAVCRSFRFSFQKKVPPLGMLSAPRDRVSQSFRSLGATLPKTFFAALVECVAAPILHSLEQRFHLLKPVHPVPEFSDLSSRELMPAFRWTRPGWEPEKQLAYFL